MTLALLADHLWQSTLCAVLAAVLAAASRAQRAQVRYAIWLAASLKFLLPFAVLQALGHAMQWRSAPPAAAVFTLAIDTIGEPFGSVVVPALGGVSRTVALPLALVCAAIWLGGSLAVLIVWSVRWRRVAASVRDASALSTGREVDALRRVERRFGIATPTAFAASTAPLEPGVFRVVHPVLLWPLELSARLDDTQMDAVLAHEICHVRRRDNLVAAVHMLIEAAFWFHPMVWWIGARLVDERERACDEDVVQLGTDRRAYAESILRTCELCVGSPLDCVAGVTGSDLKKRMERIMNSHASPTLTRSRKLLLGTLAVAAAVAPILYGAIHTPRVLAQSRTTESAQRLNTTIPDVGFRNVSVTANTSDDTRAYPSTTTGGRFVAMNARVGQLIANAYGLSGVRRQGGPVWLNTDRFDITADVDGEPSQAQTMAMVRKLLADTFGLRVHVETQTQPVFTLVVANASGALGPRLRPSVCREKGVSPPGPFDSTNPPPLPCGAFRTRPGTLTGLWQTMPEMAAGLSLILGRQVTDGTGLSGKFDMDAEWTPDSRPPGPQAFGVGPATFAAIEEQLGLKLEERNGPVQVLVIDQAEKPAS
jgi:uncharacterized protein (TIGR03435 family)